MGVKSTQIAYDKHWYDRKMSLGSGVTWQVILRAGIISLEELKKADKLQDTVKFLKIENDENSSTPRVEAPKAEEPKTIKIIINKPTHVKMRAFDVVRNNAYVTVPFEQIDLYESFRIRDDNKVVVVNGKKEFKLSKDIIKQGSIVIADVV